jgi:hypothetical protein
MRILTACGRTDTAWFTPTSSASATFAGTSQVAPYPKEKGTLWYAELFSLITLGIWLPAYGRNDHGSTVPTMENGLSFRTASSTPPLISAWVSQREAPSSMTKPKIT